MFLSTSRFIESTQFALIVFALDVASNDSNGGNTHPVFMLFNLSIPELYDATLLFLIVFLFISKMKELEKREY